MSSWPVGLNNPVPDACWLTDTYVGDLVYNAVARCTTVGRLGQCWLGRRRNVADSDGAGISCYAAADGVAV